MQVELREAERRELLRRLVAGELPDERGRFGPFGGCYAPETLMPALERLAAGDFEGLAMRASWSDRDRLWLRHEALETLAILGDQGTAERLRRDRPADVPWPPQLELALFRTGEEIAARIWEADGESSARG